MVIDEPAQEVRLLHPNGTELVLESNGGLTITAPVVNVQAAAANFQRYGHLHDDGGDQRGDITVLHARRRQHHVTQGRPPTHEYRCGRSRYVIVTN